jgi:hypothetical protein
MGIGTILLISKKVGGLTKVLIVNWRRVRSIAKFIQEGDYHEI